MDAQGNGEVRRLHIVYFLSRKGRKEHPHLIRVHHISRNGVRLKDVKRWLGELRGKDMPESFAWSYKRKYKTGYLWQDLLDDDLITPISDNEYVLKGSEISSINQEFSYTEEKSPKQKEEKQSLLQASAKENERTISSSSKQEDYSHSSDTSLYVSTKSSSEIEEDSPTLTSETSTFRDESRKHETINNPNTAQDQNPSRIDKKENRSSHFYSTHLNDKKIKKKGNRVKIDENFNTSFSPNEDIDSPNVDTSSNSEPLFSKNKNHNSNSLFHNLITCGAEDPNDSAVVMISKKKKNNKKSFMNICSRDSKNVGSVEIIKRDRIDESQRRLGTHWTHKKSNFGRKICDEIKEKREYNKDQRVSISAAYKPVNGPNCSQCGKPFKPEKMHTHMKSCKGMKAFSNNTSASASVAPTLSPSDYSSGYLLTH